MDSVERDERGRMGGAPRDVSDSASRDGYSDGVNYDASFRAAQPGIEAPEASAPSGVGDAPLPASLYRTIKPVAWLAVLGAGLVGWALLLTLA